MGEIILNGRSYNNGTKYLEVTQAQYNALPTSKLTDGTLYCITDAPGPGEGFPPMIYSYEEREVGVWVDGRPLYQKTITFTLSSGTNTVNLGVTNMGMCSFVSGFKENSGLLTFIPFVDIEAGSSIDSWSVIIYRVALSSGDITYRTASRFAGETVCATFQYTKTTDQPGSGTWTTDGMYAKHYSTEEKVIGTWIDGKPLYEKTIEFTATSTANTYTQYAHGIANVDIIMIDFSHSIIYYTETTYFQISPYSQSTGEQDMKGFVSRTSFDYRVGTAIAGKNVKLTLHYTKTTD